MRHSWENRERTASSKCKRCGLRWRRKRNYRGREISTDGGRTWVTEPRTLPACREKP